MGVCTAGLLTGKYSKDHQPEGSRFSLEKYQVQSCQYLSTGAWPSIYLLYKLVASNQKTLSDKSHPQISLMHLCIDSRYRSTADRVLLGKLLEFGLISDLGINFGALFSNFLLSGLQFLKERQVKDERLEKVDKLRKVAEGIGATLPQLAIAWTARNKNVSVVLLGATKEAQVLLYLLPNLPSAHTWEK